MENADAPTPPVDSEAVEPARGSLLLLAPAVSMSSLGILGFGCAAALCWLAGLHGEPREFALFIGGALLLPPLGAAVQVWLVQPDFRRPGAGLVETICCWAAIGILLALASVPLLMFVIGGGKGYWRQLLAASGLASGPCLGIAAALLLTRGHPSAPTLLAARTAQVVSFVLAFFGSSVVLFKIDPSDRYLNFFIRLFFEPPFSESPAPFGLGWALMLAVLAMASVVALARLEIVLIRRGSIRLPMARTIALCAATTLTVVCFFDYSLQADPYHYLLNVAPALDVLHGATAMVDTFSHYGLGPLLATVTAFRIGPATFGTAQIAVQIFNFAFCALWLGCLYRMSRLKLAASLLGFFSIACVYASWAYGYGNLNDAPSQLGLRYLPPLMMVLALSCLRPPQRHSAFTAITALVAALWSMETLVGTLGVHCAFLGMLGLRDRTFLRLAADTVRAAVPGAAGLLMFTVATLARAGTRPDFGAYLGYLAGFNLTSVTWQEAFHAISAFGSWWSLVASPRFFGWMAMLLAIFLVLSDAWARVFSPTARVTWLQDTELFYRFVPMAALLMLHASYFVGRSVDYTLVLALLPFCAIAIPASFGFTGVVTAAGGPARMLVLIPVAVGLWALTFTSLSLFRQHYSLLVRDCPKHSECSSAPYSLLLHECRDHGRCSAAAIARALADTVHARPGLERVGTPRGDFWFDRSGIVRDAVSMIETWARDEPAVTVLLSAIVPSDYLASELTLMYSGKRHRWPRSAFQEDNRVESIARRIVASADRLREGELVLVRRDEASLGRLEAAILERIRRDVTLCRLPHASTQVVAYRVAGPAGCPSW